MELKPWLYCTLTLTLLFLHVPSCMGETPLFYVDAYNIRSHDLDTGTTNILLSSAFENTFGMDFHHGNQKLYVSDVTDHTTGQALYVVDLSVLPPTVEVLLDEGLSAPEGLAVDWINNNLYWTDRVLGTGQINVIDLDTKKTATILDTSLYELRAIVLDPRDNEKWMYFTDYGFKHGIFRAGLDGAGRVTLVETDVHIPNGLSIDYTLNKLYWVDGLLDKLESSTLDGSDRITLSESLQQPFSCVPFGDDIYWTEWESLSVKKMDKNTQIIQTVTSEASAEPTAILVYDASRQPAGTASCGSNNGGCSHVCVPSLLRAYTCACPSGMAAPDGRTCVVQTPTEPPSTDLTLVWAENDDQGFTQISMAAGDPHVWLDTGETSLEHVRYNNLLQRFQAEYAAVEFRHYSGEIFVSDNGNGYVRRFVSSTVDGSITFRRVSNSSKQTNGLAVDWLSDSVYITDTLNGRITVCNGHRVDVCKHLITGLSQPFGVAVHPQLGLLFWTSIGNSPRVEKSRLDGTNRQVIVTNVGKPMGIAIDYQNNHLYYVDQLLSTIEVRDFNGREIPGLNTYSITEPEGLTPKLHDITLYDNIAFVTDQANRQILVLNLVTVKTMVITLSNVPSGVTMYDADRQQTDTRHCDALNCADICVNLGASSATCLCNSQSSGCQVKGMDACTNVTCQNGGTCVLVGSAGFECDCGFVWKGTYCQSSNIVLYSLIGGGCLFVLLIAISIIFGVYNCFRKRKSARREGTARFVANGKENGQAANISDVNNDDYDDIQDPKYETPGQGGVQGQGGLQGQNGFQGQVNRGYQPSNEPFVVFCANQGHYERPLAPPQDGGYIGYQGNPPVPPPPYNKLPSNQ